MIRSEAITVRFEPEDMDRIKKAAEKDHRPTANFIEHLVLKYFQEQDRLIQKS